LISKGNKKEKVGERKRGTALGTGGVRAKGPEGKENKGQKHKRRYHGIKEATEGGDRLNAWVKKVGMGRGGV